MSKDLKTDKLIERLEQLTGKKVVIEGEEAAKPRLNQFGSMTQLNDHFKAKDFVPSAEIFHVGKYKYEFKKAKPESIDSMKLIHSSSNSLEFVYVCKSAKSTISFNYSVGDGLAKPGSATLTK